MTAPHLPARGWRDALATPGALAAGGALALAGATVATVLRAPPPADRRGEAQAVVQSLPVQALPAPASPAPATKAGAEPGAGPLRPLPPRATRADFAGAPAPGTVRRVADWAMAAADPGGLPFLIVDKRGARLWAFGADGRGRGSAPVLLGLARGDDSVPGIGARPLAAIRPGERTTPAGRFVAEAGRNLRGEDIVWIDYDAAVSMHRVRATDPRERRLQRLASPSAADNRISYGCINVPPTFYDGVVRPLLAGGRAVVYVLPERRTLEAVFGPMTPAAGAPVPGTRAVAARAPGR
jgi:hypothetical protein